MTELSYLEGVMAFSLVVTVVYLTVLGLARRHQKSLRGD